MRCKSLIFACSIFALTAGSAQAAEWRLVEVSGTVRIAVPGAEAAPARLNQAVPTGSSITTTLGARAALDNGLQHIVVGPNSRMTVAPDAGGFTRVMQDLGAVMFKVDKQKAPHFRVDTPLLAAIVKGTTFTVVVGPQSDSVNVAEGLVEVRSNATDMASDVPAGSSGAVSHEGKFGKALLFDRPKGDHVSIPHSPDFEIGTFTVSAWVWLTKEPTFSGILGTRSGGEFTFDMKVNADKVHGDIGDGTRWIDTAINFYKDDVGSNGQGGDLETKRWSLITFVVDNEHKECRLYLDADRKKTIPFKGEPRLMRSGQTMRIGSTGNGEFMDGVIDDVRIWKQALTDQQVLSLIAP